MAVNNTGSVEDALRKIMSKVLRQDNIVRIRIPNFKELGANFWMWCR